MRWLLLTALVGTTALAGPRDRAHARFGLAWVGPGAASNSPRVTPQVVYQPVYVPLAWWTWYPVQQRVQPEPALAPEPVVIEREVVREVPAPAPQVIVIEQAAPTPPPVTAAIPAPPSELAKPPPGPRLPGPDVFTWTDEDGVVHFSTRVPGEARARAKKVGADK